MRRRVVLNLACLATIAIAVVTGPRPGIAAPPASQPAATDRATLLTQLDALTDNDPAARDAARDALMQLTRADLPALRDAASAAANSTTRPANGGRATRDQMLRAALHEIVVHVYLTGVHEFRGQTSGILGFTALNDGVSPIVLARRPGYDAYRVLQDGDSVVGLTAPRGARGMQAITDYASLIQALSQTRVGDRVTVRLIRNGQAIERTLRVGPPVGAQIEDPNLPVAELYWQRSFEPALRAAPTTELTADEAKAAADAAATPLPR